MNDKQNPTEFDDLTDRLTDRALHELLGDERPPDLSQQILAALAVTPASHAPTAAPSDPITTPSGRELALAASVLVLLVGGLAALFLPGLRSRENPSLATNTVTGKPPGNVKIVGLDGYEKQTGRIITGIGMCSDAGVVGNIVIDERTFGLDQAARPGDIVSLKGIRSSERRLPASAVFGPRNQQPNVSSVGINSGAGVTGKIAIDDGRDRFEEGIAAQSAELIKVRKVFDDDRTAFASPRSMDPMSRLVTPRILIQEEEQPLLVDAVKVTPKVMENSRVANDLYSVDKPYYDRQEMLRKLRELNGGDQSETANRIAQHEQAYRIALNGSEKSLTATAQELAAKAKSANVRLSGVQKLDFDAPDPTLTRQDLGSFQPEITLLPPLAPSAAAATGSIVTSDRRYVRVQAMPLFSSGNGLANNSKVGDGTQTLSGASTGYVGATTVSSGTLAVSPHNVSGGLIKAGSGVLTLSSANTYTGATSAHDHAFTMNGGTLLLGGVKRSSDEASKCGCEALHPPQREVLGRLARKVGQADSKNARAQQQLLIDSAQRIAQEVSARNVELSNKEAELRKFKESNGLLESQGDGLPPSLVNEFIDRDPESNALKVQVAHREKHLAVLSSVVKNPGNSPAVTAETAGVDQARRALAERQEAVRRDLLDQVKKGVIVTPARAEADAREREIEGLKLSLNDLTKEQQDLARSYQQQLADQQATLDKVAVEQKKLDSLQAENEQLRSDIRAARGAIDDWFAKTVVLTEQNHQVQGQTDRVHERQEALVSDLGNAVRVLRDTNVELSAKVDKLQQAAKAVQIEGVVTGVRSTGTDSYIQLSVGSDDNVQVGNSLEVFQGRNRVGLVVVVRAEQDKAVAKVVQQLAVIEPRDRVRGVHLPEGEDEKGRGAGDGGDRYQRINENLFLPSLGNPLSTFSIDVDTASYSNVRQFVMGQGMLPPPDAVRIEELINYFPYRYEGPKGDLPFAVHVEVADCPWHADHRLARIALKGREVKADKRPRANLVFLVDVSGSMQEPNKLPLLQKGLKLLTEQLRDDDQVAIVVYAGSEGLALPTTPGASRETILSTLDKLAAGGSTNGGAGINLAYKTAREGFIKGGINRVILCTDGDFNVGTTSDADLTRLIEEKAKEGTFLTVLGFGRGNLNDQMLESLSGKGNGNYAYVDNLREARKVLVEQLTGTIMTIAKDVKIQVEFNPGKVAGYRLLGYEDRVMAAEDFNNDKKDAGEIGAGHTVTALYELVPAGKPVDATPVDDLKYQTQQKLNKAASGDELLTVKLRYKEPDGQKSKLIEQPVRDEQRKFAAATSDFQWAAAVTAFGLLLRDSQYKGTATYDAVLEIATQHKGADVDGYRNEFLEIVRRAKELKK